MKKVDLFLLFEKKSPGSIFFFFFFFLKSSMATFLEYILDSMYILKVVDFNFFGLHRLVWFLLRK